ncbi:hypothetical protein [Hominifimenecus sp. rT4P-3]|uniref:hypothetical protein n=1 Tax=Hominifimenecus sp. rT4P-3 TaxID=3242979 RepID=UPI003DA1D904
MQAWMENREGWIARFRKTEYTAAFEEYRENCRFSIEKLNEEYLRSGSEACLRETADALIQRVQEEVGAAARLGSGILRDCSYVIVCYLIPSIRMMKLPCSEPLERNILEAWNQAYPKRILRGGSYEQILSGFPKGSILSHLFTRRQ